MVALSCLARKTEPPTGRCITRLVFLSLPPPPAPPHCRGERGQGQVGVHLAAHPPPVRDHPQLQQAPLGEVLHGHLRHRHALDRCLLLPDGVAGECGSAPDLPVGEGRARERPRPLLCRLRRVASLRRRWLIAQGGSAEGRGAVLCPGDAQMATAGHLSSGQDLGTGMRGWLRETNLHTEILRRAAGARGEEEYGGGRGLVYKDLGGAVARPPSFPGSLGECEGDNTRRPLPEPLPSCRPDGKGVFVLPIFQRRKPRRPDGVVGPIAQSPTRIPLLNTIGKV